MADDSSNSNSKDDTIENSTDEVIKKENQCEFCENKAYEICNKCKKHCCHFHEKNHECRFLKTVAPPPEPEDGDNVKDYIDSHEDFKMPTHTDKSVKYIPLLAVVLVIGLVVFVAYDSLFSPQGIILENVTEKDCLGFYAEGDFLLANNNGNRNMTEWSQADQDKGNELAGIILDYCTTVTKDVMHKLPQCTTDYVDLQRLLNSMTDMEVQSLPLEKQDDYYERYNKFFADNCDLLFKEIKSSDEYMDYYYSVVGYPNE